MAQADAKTTFEEQGYLPPADLLSPDELDRFRSGFAALERREDRRTCSLHVQNWHDREPFILELATHPRLLDAVEALFGPDLLLGDTRFFCKYPGDGGHFTWHQDAAYWGFEPQLACTCLVALDGVGEDSGGVRLIPGSHQRGVIGHRRSKHAAGNMLRRLQEVPAEYVEAERAVELKPRAGQFTVHDARIIHSSSPNRSSQRRCLFAAVFLPPHVRHGRELVEPGEILDFKWRNRKVVLVRGGDRFGHFERLELGPAVRTGRTLPGSHP